MSKVIAFEWVTLDGVMQAPAREDEDPRGGFAYGGWSVPYADPAMASFVRGDAPPTGGLLLGRRTYQDFYEVWPSRGDNPYTKRLNEAQKYVASNTLEEPLPWQNSTLLKGDAAESVARLKQELDGDLTVLGSGELLQTLIRHDLVDRFVLLINPLVLGCGRKLFRDGGPRLPLRLVETHVMASGVVMATYEPAVP
jgi:dihydrofolate reductase